MEMIGIDVHKVATQVCILTSDGEFVEFRIHTERDALTKAFGSRARARILLEAATESEWVARHLELLGHEVIERQRRRARGHGHNFAADLSKGRLALAASKKSYGALRLTGLCAQR